eukprot:2689581-Prymnesium_polylepis.1
MASSLVVGLVAPDSASSPTASPPSPRAAPSSAPPAAPPLTSLPASAGRLLRVASTSVSASGDSSATCHTSRAKPP